MVGKDFEAIETAKGGSHEPRDQNNIHYHPHCIEAIYPLFLSFCRTDL